MHAIAGSFNISWALPFPTRFRRLVFSNFFQEPIDWESPSQDKIPAWYPVATVNSLSQLEGYMRPFSFCTNRFRNFPVWASYSEAKMSAKNQNTKNRCSFTLRVQASLKGALSELMGYGFQLQIAHQCRRVTGQRGLGWLSVASRTLGLASCWPPPAHCKLK